MRVVEVPGLIRPAGRRAVSVQRNDLGAGVVEEQPLAVSLLVRHPDPSVGPHARLQDHARLGRKRLERPGVDLVAVRTVTALEAVHEENGRRIGPPVVDEDRSLEIDGQILPLAAREIPEAGSLFALALVVEREPLVAGHG